MNDARLLTIATRIADGVFPEGVSVTEIAKRLATELKTRLSHPARHPPAVDASAPLPSPEHAMLSILTCAPVGCARERECTALAKFTKNVLETHGWRHPSQRGFPAGETDVVVDWDAA